MTDDNRNEFETEAPLNRKYTPCRGLERVGVGRGQRNWGGAIPIISSRIMSCDLKATNFPIPKVELPGIWIPATATAM